MKRTAVIFLEIIMITVFFIACSSCALNDTPDHAIENDMPVSIIKSPEIDPVINLSSGGYEFFATGIAETVYFYAETTGDIISVSLIDSENNVIDEMEDDGKYGISGDNSENDGVFTCKVSIDMIAENTLIYRAVSTVNGFTVESNEVSIKISVPLTDRDLENIEMVDNAINNLFETFTYETLEQKRIAVQGLLESFNGTLITDIYYSETEKMFSYSYINSGVPGKVLLEDLPTSPITRQAE